MLKIVRGGGINIPIYKSKQKQKEEESVKQCDGEEGRERGGWGGEYYLPRKREKKMRCCEKERRRIKLLAQIEAILFLM